MFIQEVRYADQETYHGDSSINSNASDGLNDYLDEALEDNETDDSNSENDLNMKTVCFDYYYCCYFMI